MEGEAHVFDGFLIQEDLQILDEIFKESYLPHNPNWSVGDSTGAKKIKFKGRRPRAVDRIRRKIRSYAMTRLRLNTTLDTHAYDGDLWDTRVSLFRYEPGAGRVTPHTDTDYHSRCLSAALYLSDDTVGGHLQLMKCKDPNYHPGCIHRTGPSLLDLYANATSEFRKSEFPDLMGHMRITEEVAPKRGRLVFFLSETFHGTSTFLSGHRNVMFMWFACDKRCACQFEGGLCDQALCGSRYGEAPG